MSEFDPKSHTHTPLELDALAAKFVQGKWLDWERWLMRSKWFDYRGLHPVEATALYAHAYNETWTEAYATHRDSARAEYIKLMDPIAVISGKDDKQVRTRFIGAFRGRQIADAIGMPYPEYVRDAMTYRLRRWQRRYLPLPVHLYSEAIVQHAQERWEERKRTRLHLATDEVFRAPYTLDTCPHRNAYHEYLRELIISRASSPYLIARLIADGSVPKEKALQWFDEATMADVSSAMREQAA